MGNRRKRMPRVTYDISINVEKGGNKTGYLEGMMERLTGENVLVKGFIQKYMHEIQTHEQAAVAMLMLYDMLDCALDASKQVRVKVLDHEEAAKKLFDMAEKAPDDYDLN